MLDITAEFWVLFALFVLTIAVSTSSVSKQSGKNSAAMYITRGAVEVLFAILLVAIVGDELEIYWDLFDIEYIGDFIERNLECFLGGIMFVICGIGGIVDLIIGFARKGK